MFGPARGHANIVCKSSRSARCQILQIVRSSAAWRQWCKGSCVPRLAIGAVFACRAGVEVLWAHVLSVGLRGQRPLAGSLTSTTLARPAKLRFHGRARKCSLAERVPENLKLRSSSCSRKGVLVCCVQRQARLGQQTDVGVHQSPSQQYHRD
jgi:hypothetical protein